MSKSPRSKTGLVALCVSRVPWATLCLTHSDPEQAHAGAAPVVTATSPTDPHAEWERKIAPRGGELGRAGEFLHLAV
jgi:hypothetical protein